MDSQVESRAEYYAEIAVKIDLDVSPVGEYLRKYDGTDESGWNTHLAVDTLDELARRGHQPATEMLIEYIRWGTHWEHPFYNSSAVRNDALVEGLTKSLELRFPSDEDLKKGIDWFFLDQEPWLSMFRYSPRFATFQNNARKRSDELRKQKDFSHLDRLTVAQLLGEDFISNDAHYYRKALEKIVTPADIDFLVSRVSVEKPALASVAFSGLAKLAPPRIFDWLKKFWTDHPDLHGLIMRGLWDLIVAMPPDVSLPLAREWVFHKRRHERWFANRVLRVHATREDIPLLRRAIRLALRDDEKNLYRICDLVEAFDNLPDVGVIPELLEVYTQFRYSHGRMLAAQAIEVTSPNHFEEGLAFECLWDCQAGTRELAVERVLIDGPAARARVVELGADIFEDDDVREAACKRLEKAA
ncbi:MAG TPA: hypothetical protein VF773_05210 [Verrucomicrobiae bacterium]